MILQPDSLSALEEAIAKAARWQARAERLFKNGTLSPEGVAQIQDVLLNLAEVFQPLSDICFYENLYMLGGHVTCYQAPIRCPPYHKVVSAWQFLHPWLSESSLHTLTHMLSNY